MAEHPNPIHWLPNQSWLHLVALSNHHRTFSTILVHLRGYSDSWRQWYDLEAPEAEALPEGLWAPLSQPEYLLLVRAIREDRTVFKLLQSVF